MNQSNLYKTRCGFCSQPLREPYMEDPQGLYHWNCYNLEMKRREAVRTAERARWNAGIEVLTEEEWER